MSVSVEGRCKILASLVNKKIDSGLIHSSFNKKDKKTAPGMERLNVTLICFCLRCMRIIPGL